MQIKQFITYLLTYLLQVLLRLLGHSHYSTNSGGRWPGTFWAVLHQVLPLKEQMMTSVRKTLKNAGLISAKLIDF